MFDLLIMVVIATILYVFLKIMLKEPILPWKEKINSGDKVIHSGKKRRKRKHEVQIELEPQLFEEMFENIKDISNHMIRFKDNSFTMIAEVEPVNYFLKSQDEQETIDMEFESWLASINYPVQFHLQNRYIDISDPIKNMQENMIKSEDLNEAALDFGMKMIEDLRDWQNLTPRYETKRYLVFSHKINTNDINADSLEEMEEKIIEKTFSELNRRMNAAKNQLRKAEMGVSLLPTEGIYELLYHTFNRRKAVKQRFKDMIESEKNAMYVTADQTDEQIEAVKEAIEENERKQKQESTESQAV